VAFLTPRYRLLFATQVTTHIQGYGIALPKNSPLRDVLSKTVLQLQERTILEALKNKWWQSKSDAQNCPANTVDKYSSLRVYGIFFVLFASIVFAVIAAVGECVKDLSIQTIHVFRYFVESKQQSPRLDYTLLGKLSNWIYKRKTNQTTMSGLRQRMQLYGYRIFLNTHNQLFSERFPSKT
jgi:hypothetical protein